MVHANHYGGALMEDPNAHLKTFLDICATYKMNGVSSDYIKLSLFGLSLNDDAREWLDSLDKPEIKTRNEMCTLFLNKFFLPSRAHKLLNEINQFQQFEDEYFYEACERFKKMLRTCPNYGIDKEEQVICFCCGLTKTCKKERDYASKGGFLNNDVDVALEIIELTVNISYEDATDRR